MSHEERQKAFFDAVTLSMEHTEYDEHKWTDESVLRRELLRDCVAIPASEYAMLRRALLMAWDHANYVGNTRVETINGGTTHWLSSFDKYNLLFIDIGFLEDVGGPLHRVTHEAHAFAESMKGQP